MTETTTFAADDWRAHQPGVHRRRATDATWPPCAALEKFAADRGITISQLAIAWTLANPAVHVAIVGARTPAHVADSRGR